MGRASLSGHQSAKMMNDEWLTPPDILAKLGHFDLDPCSPERPPWGIADRHFHKTEDGLSRPWEGRIWLNPPFGRLWPAWVRKLADHGNGIALLAARTETEAFFELVWARASAVLFLRGRPHFHFVTGERGHHNSGAPICLVAYDKAATCNANVLAASGLGHLVRLNE